MRIVALTHRATGQSGSYLSSLQAASLFHRFISLSALAIRNLCVEGRYWLCYSR